MLESELFTLLQGTTDAAFSVTEEGEILSWNKAAEKLLGYSAAEAVHKTCYDILEGMGTLGTRVCHQHCSVTECTAGNAEIPNFDMSVKTRSGERLWVNMSTIVFDNQRTGPPASGASGPRHHRTEEERRIDAEDAGIVEASQLAHGSFCARGTSSSAIRAGEARLAPVR